MVRNLINHDSQEYNKELIEQIFNVEDAINIQKQPFLSYQSNDELIWNYNRDGKYNIQSAYHGIMESILDTSHLKVFGNWSSIWNLKISPKIKHFTWRIQRDCIPTRAHLSQKGINCSNLVLTVYRKWRMLGTYL